MEVNRGSMKHRLSEVTSQRLKRLLEVEVDERCRIDDYQLDKGIERESALRS